MTKRSDAEDLRAAVRLLVQATIGVTDVVESMHRTIGSGPALLGRPLATPFHYTVRPLYDVVRGITRLAGEALDRLLVQLAKVLSEDVPGPQRMALIAALNGVLGDHLAETHSVLAIAMALCRNGTALPLEPDALRAALPDATGRLLVLAHGSSMYEGQWLRAGHDHGALLERELGYTAVHVRFNSGLHISTNGRELAHLLEQLVAAWPVPIEELTLLGHSMGGLVFRSACDLAEREGLAWRSRLSRMVFLGTPHHGAPLERAGNWLDYFLSISPYSAPLASLGKIRSAGVTDLRYGSVRDEDWMGMDRFHRAADARSPLPLPSDVQCYAIAACRRPVPGRRFQWDGMVPVPSALGQHPSTARTLAFPESHRFIAYGTDHLGMLGSPAVYARLKTWLSG